MDGLTALLAGLVASLRGVLGTDACPGGWPWAVSALGVGVGLLPTAGLVGVAALRRRIGSRYGVGESALFIGLGVVSAGLLPLLAFTATGRIFTLAAAGQDVPGLTGRQTRDLAQAACLDLSQADYLGEYSVSEAFSIAAPLRFGLALLLLVLFPLLAAGMVALQARLALRRGPSWPGKFFWLPLLSVAVLTADVAAGSTGQLWVGVADRRVPGDRGAAAGGAAVPDVVRRSLARDAGTDDPQRARRPVRTGRPGGRGRSAPRCGPAVEEPPAAPAPTAGQPGPTPTAVPPGPPGRRPPGAAARHRAPGRPPRFQLVRRLGSGGFGRVWLAHDARLGQQVALKAAHAPDAETEQRIQREARALAAIRHPNCVRIHDLVPARSDPGLAELDGMVIVMEYVDGSRWAGWCAPRRARRRHRGPGLGRRGRRAARRAPARGDAPRRQAGQHRAGPGRPGPPDRLRDRPPHRRRRP